MRCFVALAVEHGATEMRQLVRKGGGDAIAPLAAGHDGHSIRPTVGDDAPRDHARLILGQQRKLIEIVRRIHRFAQKVQGKHRCASVAQGHHRGDIFLGEGTHDEAGALRDGLGVGAAHRFRGHIVDFQARAGCRSLFEVGGNEAVAHRDADGLAAARQRQQQSDLIGKFRRGGDLGGSHREHAVVRRMLRIQALPVGECRGCAHGIARESYCDGSQFQPSDDDGVGLGGCFQRRSAFRGAANSVEEFRAIRAQAGGIAEPALALDQGAGAFDRVPGEKGAASADPKIILRLIGRRRYRDLIQLANGAGAVVLRVGDFRRDQRTRGGNPRARLGRHRSERLFGGCDIAGSQPLFGAQQLVIIMVGRLQGREFRVGLRRLRMLAVASQMQRALLLVLRGLHRLQQAARGQYRRYRERRVQRQPWTSRDRCHTLHSWNTHRRGL